MLEFLHQAVTVDTYTLVVVAMLAGWAGVLTRHVLSRTLMALVFVPGFVVGALVTNYIFEINSISPTPDRETNVVVACTLGIILALFVLLVCLRISTAMSGLRVQRHQFRRA
jgi:ABC-type sulfate transport system permease component